MHSGFRPEDVLYDQATHTSTLDGESIPHVTTVLRETGVSVDFEAVARISPRRAAALRFARDRGTALHADAHAYDDDDLDVSAVGPDILPWLEAWVACRAATGLRPIVRERRVLHPIHLYTGIKDGIFELPNGKRILVDLKTGDPDDSAAEFQTAAYEAAHLAQHPEDRIDARWAVELLPRQRVPYRIVDYSARPDCHTHYPRFLCFLATWRDQAVRRRRA